MKLPNVLSHATQLNCCLFVFLVLLIAGCGGGGGGGTPVTTTVGFGNSLPPETGAGDVENFFPVVQGTSWNYLATVTNPTAGIPYSYMDSISVTGTKAVGGKVASVFLDSNPSGSGIPFEGYYYKTAGGVSFLGSSDTANEMATGIVPYIVSLFPVSPSVVADFQKNRLDFGSDLDGDGINERMDITLTSTINGFEPLTIGIGPFARTVKNTLAVSGSVVLSQSKTAIPFSSTSTRWSAPGIGIIKNIQGAIVQSITTSEIMELRGYTSNGVAHGFGMPVTVASNLPFNLLPLGGTPSLASSGQNFLAVTESASGLLGMLFDTQGGVISNLNLATVTGSVSPISAFDSTNYWVLYTPYSYGTSGSMDTCLAQRVSPAGALIDATAINLLTLGVGYSSITSKGFAFGNANGLLVYSTYNLSTWQHELHGVLVNPDMTFSASFPIATDNSTHLNPVVAFDGTSFFVVWEQLPTSGATVASINGVRVSNTGTVLDAAPLVISSAPNGQSSPSVAFDGTNYLVVWLDLRNQTTSTGLPYPDIYGARVSTAGVLLDGSATTGGFAINTSGSIQRSSPHVIFIGSEYLVTWASLGYANSGSPGVQAARVSTAGILPSGINMAVPVSGPPSVATVSQYTNSVMAAGQQRAAVVWFDNQNTGKILAGALFSPF